MIGNNDLTGALAIAAVALLCLAGCGSSNPNSAPTVDSLSLSPSAPTTVTDIVAQASGSDADGDALTYQYAWYVNGMRVASGSSDTLPSSNFVRGDTVKCVVTASDGKEEGAPAEVSVSVVNAVGMWTAMIVLGAGQHQCVVSGSDPDGDVGVPTYQWSGFTAFPIMQAPSGGNAFVAPNCTGDSEFLDALCAQSGDMLTCSVTISDGIDAVMISATPATVP